MDLDIDEVEIIMCRNCPKVEDDSMGPNQYCLHEEIEMVKERVERKAMEDRCC